LATAGSGDVLSGIVGGLLAATSDAATSDASPDDASAALAAALGVAVHGLAGRIAARRGAPSATEVLAAVGDAFARAGWVSP
jgi:NAD(P)H-hydrate epimerase